MIYRLIAVATAIEVAGCEPKEHRPPPSVIVSVAQAQPSAAALGVKVIAATRGGSLLRIEVTGGTVTAPGSTEPSQVLCLRVGDGLHPMMVVPTGDEALVSSALFGSEVVIDGSVTSGTGCSTGSASPLDTDITPIAKPPVAAVIDDAATDAPDEDTGSDTGSEDPEDSGPADTGGADAVSVDGEGDAT